jgi:hypothetical protein
MPDSMQPTSAPKGFGKGVSDYFNHFIALADAKAAGFVAASLTVGAAVLKMHGDGTLPATLRWLSVGCLSGTVLTCTWSILPRLPSGRRGLVFWEDVRTYKNLEDYQDQVSHLTDAAVEREYAAQNYFVADVVHRKHAFVRMGVIAFLGGVAFAVSAYALR